MIANLQGWWLGAGEPKNAGHVVVGNLRKEQKHPKSSHVDMDRVLWLAAGSCHFATRHDQPQSSKYGGRTVLGSLPKLT